MTSPDEESAAELMIVAGEASGDLHASLLLEELGRADAQHNIGGLCSLGDLRLFALKPQVADTFSFVIDKKNVVAINRVGAAAVFMHAASHVRGFGPGYRNSTSSMSRDSSSACVRAAW